MRICRVACVKFSVTKSKVSQNGGNCFKSEPFYFTCFKNEALNEGLDVLVIEAFVQTTTWFEQGLKFSKFYVVKTFNYILKDTSTGRIYQPKKFKKMHDSQEFENLEKNILIAFKVLEPDDQQLMKDSFL